MDEPKTDAGAAKPNGAMVQQSPEVEETYQGLAVFKDPKKEIVTSLDVTNEDDNYVILGALAAADFQIDDVLGKTLEIQHYLAHEVQLVKPDTGEVFTAVRLVLITPKGDTYSTCSKPFTDLFRAVLAMKFKPPWEPPLRLEVFKAKRSSMSAGKKPGGYLQFKLIKPVEK